MEMKAYIYWSMHILYIHVFINVYSPMNYWHTMHDTPPWIRAFTPGPSGKYSGSGASSCAMCPVDSRQTFAVESSEPNNVKPLLDMSIKKEIAINKGFSTRRLSDSQQYVCCVIMLFVIHIRFKCKSARTKTCVSIPWCLDGFGFWVGAGCCPSLQDNGVVYRCSCKFICVHSRLVIGIVKTVFYQNHVGD